MKRRSRGFTLIELLVVVAIIAILSVIGLTIFTSVQANARDARRRVDIDAIANAIEVAKSSGSVYYTSLPASGFSGGAVPTDSTTAKYCIKTVTGGATLPTDAGTGAWGTAGCIDNAWFAISSAGLSVSADVTGVTSSTVFGWQITGWKVCARLENSTAVYCKPSAQ